MTAKLNPFDVAHRIALSAQAQGGRVYYVGGLVRDRLMGRAGKDVDIEVHGIAPAALEAMLDAIGERLTMGVSFGIYGLRHCDIDIAMPRTETTTGRGHRDFTVDVDPFLGVRKACMRRDFTINAMMEDVLTGEIIDPFGGRADIRRGVIRHVDANTFAEDPLRVLRGAQFAARFGFAIAPETVALCARMDLSALPRERIEGELSKALLKAGRPSAFFESLRAMRQLTVWFPEVQALGAQWDGVMAALDAAAPLRRRAQNPLGFMLAALVCRMDAAQAESQLHRLTAEVRLVAYAHSLAAHADAIVRAAREQPPVPRTNALFDGVQDAQALALLARALGVGAQGEAFLAQRLEAYRACMARARVQGRDLIAAGLAPGKDFTAILAHAHALHLSGADKDEALRGALAYAAALRGGDGQIPAEDAAHGEGISCGVSNME